ncbi:hypothetical protein K4F52_008492 [Lecanicillium sp. MT-2017a]|nr:hypothetical protein K4F52_008492 [Lecanicillium sp. MT-2017a]
MALPHVSPTAQAALNDDGAENAGFNPRQASSVHRRRPRNSVKPHCSFKALAISAVAVMTSGATAAAAAAPRDGVTSSMASAVAASALHLPILTHDAPGHEVSQQLEVDTNTITHFSRELGLVKRDPRPGDKDDPSGSWSQQLQPRDSESSSSSKTSSSSSSDSTSLTSDASSSPLPQPFDNTPASVFKSPGEDESCPNFITSLLADSTFKNCYPLSMLLFTSRAFFQAQKQFTSIVRVLDATCAADSSSCGEFMEKAAKNLVSESNCKKEFDNGQAKVVDAFNGLRAYSVMYSATCLQTKDTDNPTYCYASAVTNTTHPSDIFLYSLPYNVGLPGSSAPSCDWCTSETMAIFHSATSDSSQPISTTYKDAARQVNTICGPDFVNATALSAARGLVPNVNNALAVTVVTVVLTLSTLWL